VRAIDVVVKREPAVVGDRQAVEDVRVLVADDEEDDADVLAVARAHRPAVLDHLPGDGRHATGSYRARSPGPISL